VPVTVYGEQLETVFKNKASDLMLRIESNAISPYELT
jgi:hypothetical protein